jgi:hypothetical protein
MGTIFCASNKAIRRGIAIQLGESAYKPSMQGVLIWNSSVLEIANQFPPSQQRPMWAEEPPDTLQR